MLENGTSSTLSAKPVRRAARKAKQQIAAGQATILNIDQHLPIQDAKEGVD